MSLLFAVRERQTSRASNVFPFLKDIGHPTRATTGYANYSVNIGVVAVRFERVRTIKRNRRIRTIRTRYDRAFSTFRE